MPKIVNKTLVFPISGVARRDGYEQTPPFATPWAVNVRGICSLERRKRGGSRPGLVAASDGALATPIEALLPITYLDSAGKRQCDLVAVAGGIIHVVKNGSITVLSTFLMIGDVDVLIDDEEIEFGAESNATDATERNGLLYIADDVLKTYNPNTGIVEEIAATSGTIPQDCPYIALYRDRVILAGENHVWYASRQSDPTDWNFGADMGDVGRAVAGQVERSGRIGDTITALIVAGDNALIFASENQMWVLRGDPTVGDISKISGGIGVLSNSAWAIAPDNAVAFLSNDGVYVMLAGSTEPPQRWSADRVPDELRDVDSSENVITMEYDVRSRGFHLYIVPSSGVGQHWFLDYANRALWPVVLRDGHQPLAMARLHSSGAEDVILGCRDGYLRKFDDDADTDDGHEIESHATIGPFKLATGEMSDALLNEIHGIMAHSGISTVRWGVIVGSSAEDVADKAEAAIKAHLARQDVNGVFCYGEWHGGRNIVSRPRARGPWAAIWLMSHDAWAYESIAVRINQLGRIRHGY